MYKTILSSIILAIALLLISSYTYNNSGEVFFQLITYNDSTSYSKAYKSDSYISNQSDGNMLAYFDVVLDPYSSSRRVAIVEIYIPSNQLDFYKPDLKINYMEKQKGKILFQASTTDGLIELNHSEISLNIETDADEELTEFNLFFGFYVNSPTGRFFISKGKITSTTISEEYQNNNSGDDNYYDDDDSVSCFSDPYEDDEYEDDSSCAGDPDNSGVENDNDSPGCGSSDSDYDDSSESSDCSSGDSDGDYDSSAESSSCGGDTDDSDDDNSDSGDCSGDTVEASGNSFTKKRDTKNLKRFQHLMTPIFFISLFVFYLRRKGERNI